MRLPGGSSFIGIDHTHLRTSIRKASLAIFQRQRGANDGKAQANAEKLTDKRVEGHVRGRDGDEGRDVGTGRVSGIAEPRIVIPDRHVSLVEHPRDESHSVYNQVERPGCRLINRG